MTTELPVYRGFEGILEAIWTHNPPGWQQLPLRFKAGIDTKPVLVQMRDANGMYLYRPDVGQGPMFFVGPIEFDDDPSMRGRMVLEVES